MAFGFAINSRDSRPKGFRALESTGELPNTPFSGVRSNTGRESVSGFSAVSVVSAAPLNR